MPDDVIRIDADVALAERAHIPRYLQDTYWWAYVHPNAVSIFERQWLVNAILWGNFAKLRDAALDELGTTIHGRNLQVACVYGDFTPRINARLADDAWLDVVDVLPIQLSNLRSKLPDHARVTPLLRNSANLGIASATYDQSILFFLLHEQPEDVRRQTLAEAVRVTKPGGRIVIVDYHRPRHPHPLRYLFAPILNLLEPFAMDLWRSEVLTWLPSCVKPEQIRKQTYFGGLYQKLVITL
jgi:ubiquinone/menaquinone biosynthesis C-methylase UbiE